ncbi:aldo/keto reductase [Frateuria aurantia]
MQYRSLGRHGLTLSALSMDFRSPGLGPLARSQVRELLAAVVDSGINYFHTRSAAADAAAQQLLAELIADLHLPRDRYCLGAQMGAAMAMPAWPNQRGLSRKALREACDQTLRRLGTDYLDLLLCEGVDGATPLEETVSALNSLVEQGKLLYWGLAGWPAAEAAEVRSLAMAAGRHPPIALQTAADAPSAEVFELAQADGLGVLADLPGRGAEASSAWPLEMSGWLASPLLSSLVLPWRSTAGLVQSLAQARLGG